MRVSNCLSSFRKAIRFDAWSFIPLFAFVVQLPGCGGPTPAIPRELTKPPPKPTPYTFGEALKKFDAEPDPEYRLGEGDVLTIQVWDRADLSVSQVVGPDGAITVPVAGTLRVSGKTREEATRSVKEALSKFYAKIAVTVRVDRYVSNRIVILGNVRAPGVLQFDTAPTLLEALARAGGLATPERPTNLTHCAIVRGRDKVAWLDLRSLLQEANLSLNLRLRPNDLVFIPEHSDLPIYVLGQVTRPGLFRWTANLSLLDAIGLAGGANRDANADVYVFSPSRGHRATVRMEELQTGVKGHDVMIQSGDIVYLTTSGLADIGYVLEQLNPFGWIFLGLSIRGAVAD